MQVAKYLSDHGIQVNMATIQAAVQSAYELSMLTPTVSPDKRSAQKVDDVNNTQPVGTLSEVIAYDIKSSRCLFWFTSLICSGI